MWSREMQPIHAGEPQPRVPGAVAMPVFQHVRVRQQNENALAIARFLAGHRAVSRVHYPGLESHPAHKLGKELFDGFGGMLSVELHGGVTAAERAILRMKIALHAPSLGGVETLISRPAVRERRGLTPEQRRSIGIEAGLIVLVGIENACDLIDDFAEALQ